MTIQLHKAIAAVAKTDPAVHVSERVIVNLLTNRLNSAVQLFVGHYQKFPDARPVVQIGLKSCSYNAATANWRVHLPLPGTQPGAFLLSSSAQFSAVFAIAKVDDKAIELCTVRVDVNSVGAMGFIQDNRLTLEDPQLTLVTTLTEDVNYAANLIACGLTDAQVKRLEGLVEHSVAPSAVTRIFQGAAPIDLQSLFPMITFQGMAELAVVAGGLLIVAREGATLNESACCPCGAAAPAIVTAPGVPTPNPVPAIGGVLPISVSIPPPAAQTPENTVDGQLSLYLPKQTLDGMSAGPYPAIAGSFDDNGFIGYSVDYTVAWRSAQLSLTDPRATVVLGMEFYFNCHGEVNVDVPCVGRQIVGRFWASNRQERSTLEVGVSPKLSPDGRLMLEGELLSLSIGKFTVDVVTILATLLSYFGGWGSIAGFVFDRILGSFIANRLQSQLSRSIKEILGKLNWMIFDLSKFDLSLIGGRNIRVAPAVSRDKDSALFGFSVGDHRRPAS